MESAALIYRHAWDAPRDHEVEFAVYSHGVAERMPTGRVRQVANVDDWLLIVFHDAAVVRVAGNEVAVGAGEAIVWAPSQLRDYGNMTQPWVHSWLQFSGQRVQGLLAQAQVVPGEPWRASQPEIVELGLRRLHAERTAYERAEPRILGNLFENWLLEIRRGEREQGSARAIDLRLRAIKRRLDMEGNRTVTLAEMGRWAGLSPSHLISSFKQRFGESPVSYHISRRMDLARFLLTNRSMTVGEVGAAVGYEELPAFSRTFKRVVGVGPREYRGRYGSS